jgi:gliding motility-associated-like protein
MQQKPLFLRLCMGMKSRIIHLITSIMGLLAYSEAVIACPVISSYDLTPATCAYNSDAVLTVNATGTGPLQYSIDGTTFQASPTFTGLLPGVYILTIQSALPCTITDTVTVYSTSFLSADLLVSTSDTLFVNETFTFYDNSFNASSWTFLLGDGSDTSDVPSINYSYPSAGAYNVVLIATDGICFDTTSLQVIVTSASALRTPNVFSPNNDDLNDVWMPDAQGMQEMRCVIMNRYGEVVHEWSGQNGYWDGHSFPSGIACNEGTYFYWIVATGFDGQAYNENGTITLLR